MITAKGKATVSEVKAEIAELETACRLRLRHLRALLRVLEDEAASGQTMMFPEMATISERQPPAGQEAALSATDNGLASS